MTVTEKPGRAMLVRASKASGDFRRREIAGRRPAMAWTPDCVIAEAKASAPIAGPEGPAPSSLDSRSALENRVPAILQCSLVSPLVTFLNHYRGNEILPPPGGGGRISYRFYNYRGHLPPRLHSQLE